MVRAERRIDVRRNEVEVVRGSRSSRGKRHRDWAPAVTTDAEELQNTDAQIDEPTTDEKFLWKRSFSLIGLS